MIKIECQIDSDGLIQPSHDIPDGVAAIICDGKYYHCFEEGDTIPDLSSGETIERYEDTQPGLFTRIVNWIKGMS